MLKTYLQKQHKVIPINFSCSLQKNNAAFVIKLFARIKAILDIQKNCKEADVVYYSLAESFFGILRDFTTFALCFKYLDKFYLHLYGGNNLKKIIYSRCFSYRLVAKVVLTKIKKIFCEGNEQKKFLKLIAPKKNIFVIPNFFNNELLLEKKNINIKFKRKIIKILFLSNFCHGKGYLELLEAFKLLPAKISKQTELHFAGAFLSKFQKIEFIKSIKKINNVFVHGLVKSKKKYKLFKNAHIFCLPTYYKYEGQPFVLFEAYAAGCFVITTRHMGIPTIFKNNINGKYVAKNSVESLKKELIRCLKNKKEIKKAAVLNNLIAQKMYSEKKFKQTIRMHFNLKNSK